MPYENQIEETLAVLENYRRTKASAAQVIARISSIQRSASRGKAASNQQRQKLSEAFYKNVSDQNKAEASLTAFANRHLE